MSPGDNKINYYIFQVILSKKGGHLLKKAYHIANITLKKFVSAK